MPIEPGERLGAYEIGSRLGTGAMGDVFRARDLRLGREVALKVLPERFREDRDRCIRFEAEALALSALNHPNVVTVYGAETRGETGFIAMELVEGKSLRALLQEGPVPPRKALDVAAQAAAGLAAAHAAGIVHRDLKPENLMIGPGGLVKVVDFGIARRTLAAVEGEPRDPTVRITPHVTEAGAVVGTVSYMSPEQAEGREADFRSDHFALGVVLHEMLSGRSPFHRDSAGATLAAILRDEAPPLPSLPGPLAAPVGWILERCLAKDPAERYGSTADLARDLANARDVAARGAWSAAPAVTVPVSAPRNRSRLVKVLLLLVPFLVAGGVWLGTRLAKPPEVEYRRLTFRRGTVGAARFATRDGSTVVYSAAWDGKESRLYRSRVDAPEATELPFGRAGLIALSRQGSLALQLVPRPEADGAWIGTLAEAPLEGGTARPLTEDVLSADFAPDGRLAIARSADGGCRLEFPPGTEIHRTAGWIGSVRISPDGRRIAFLAHPSPRKDDGSVWVGPLAGRPALVGPEYWPGLQGLSWSRSGDRVWFTAARSEGSRALYEIDLKGSLRRVAQFPSSATLHDIAPDGRVLFSREARWIGIVRRDAGGRDEDLSWLESSLLADLSPDGRTLLFTEFGETSGEMQHVYVWKPGAPLPTRLGSGTALALSPDGAWALAVLPGEKPSLVALPLGIGAPMRLPPAAVEKIHWAAFLPGQKSLLFAANATDRPVRLWVQEIASGALRPVSPEGIFLGFPGIAVSPDGRLAAAMGADGRIGLHDLVGGSAPRILAGPDPGLVPVDFTPDGRSLFAFDYVSMPARLYRVDVGSGRTTPRAELAPADRAGLFAIPAVHVSADGSVVAYSYFRYLSELYVADGLQ